MSPRPDLLCIGSVHWDVIGRAPAGVGRGADVPGRIVRAPGGVALNLAAAFSRQGLRPAVLTAIGRDAEGEALVAACARMGVETGYAWRDPDLPTDRYLAIEDPGGLVAAIADARSLEAAGARILAPLADGRLGSAAAPWPGLAALDGNLTAQLLAEIAVSPLLSAADLRVAPASPGKAERLRVLLSHPRATFYLNRAEAAVLAGTEPADAMAAAAALRVLGARRVLVTDGSRPAAEAEAGGALRTVVPPRVAVARVTGAGDAFMAAHVLAEVRGADREAALAAAVAAAADHVSGEIDA